VQRNLGEVQRRVKKKSKLITCAYICVHFATDFFTSPNSIIIIYNLPKAHFLVTTPHHEFITAFWRFPALIRPDLNDRRKNTGCAAAE
jgi:hypothetical protein